MIERKIAVDVEKEIRDFIVENFLFGNREKLPDDDDSFLQKGLIDSTGILEVVNFIEEKFGIRVEDDDLVPENLDSVRRLADFIVRKRGLKI
jgi:acyl carrier protein